jgi:hypothetical protein
MNSPSLPFGQIALVPLLVLFLVTPAALAGPPLICHSFDIGEAKSLPWISHDWNLTGTETYETRNLAADTLAILNSDSVILVHMETLRRATLYAHRDPIVAKQLLTKLLARANSAGYSRQTALASFDAGYFAETYKQLWDLNGANPAQGFDGFALVKRAMQLRGNDPQMDFAAALLTMGSGPVNEQQEYAQKALAGAKYDALLARNLTAHFLGPQSKTMAEMIFHSLNVKAAKQ